MKIKYLTIVLSIIFVFNLEAQKQKNAGQIYEELEKFNFLGSAMYVAAHPDDENTRLISFLSNGLNARTAYLSMTRGDGGQNLIGTEIRELLGVIRSQELQMARSVDGGQQFFTRANDFGYSKHPDETFKIWDKDKVLEDVVYAIRKFKPDIIVNRFDHRTPGRTHGHHTGSAMLSKEAFELASDPKAYPHQLRDLDTWQVRRQFFNTSWWFYGSREKFAKADKSNLVSVEAGGYYPTIGISNNEIAALARSKHRSQGFGSSGDRSSYQEYLEIINGDLPEDKDNIFDGIDTRWTRLDVGEKIQPIMDRVMDEFNFKNPSEIVAKLLDVRSILLTSKDSHWKNIKINQVNEIIVDCLGLHLEASTNNQESTIGDSIEVVLEWTNRSKINVIGANVFINDKEIDFEKNLQPFTTEKEYVNFFISENLGFSNPYWLNSKGALGIYDVRDPKLRNLPETPAPIKAVFHIIINDQILEIKRDVRYRYVNPAEGEIRQPHAIIPPATVKFDKEMYLFSSDEPQEIELKVRAGKENVEGLLEIELPLGWTIEPKFHNVLIDKRGLEKTFKFTLTSPDKISEGKLKANVILGDVSYNKSLINIDYDHIPLQTILSPAESKAVKVPLNRGGTNIGYVMGAGDKVPENLRNVGYSVTELAPENLPNLNLSGYDAIVIGIRAYNAVTSLKLYNDVLFKYAEDGGTLITQYNTSRRLNFDDLSPYPLKLSRLRVTDENAEMRILRPDHAAMNYPNKITAKDFDGWVQERGLYFSEEWDNKFEAILSCNDPGEDPLDGSLLIAQHGKGYFVYTSLSWFRELPAGVPGAYRIFANLLALSDSKKNRP